MIRTRLKNSHVVLVDASVGDFCSSVGVPIGRGMKTVVPHEVREREILTSTARASSGRRRCPGRDRGPAGRLSELREVDGRRALRR